MTNPIPISIVGTGATLTVTDQDSAAALTLGAGASLSIRGLTVMDGGDHRGDVLDCLGATGSTTHLDLTDASILGGFTSSLCITTIQHSSFGGFLQDGGTVSMTRSTSGEYFVGQVSPPTNLTIANSLISDLKISTGNLISIDVTFSTIYKGVSFQVDSKGLVNFENDVITSLTSQAAVNCLGMCPVQAANNIIFPPATNLMTDNIAADPRYVDPTKDFHLKSGSPAIDGADTTTPPATDLDGTARPVGPRADLGAYEFH